MWLIALPGILSLVFGIIFITAPQRVMWSKPTVERPFLETDVILLKHRISTGICLIAVGVFCLLSSFYVWLRLHA